MLYESCAKLKEDKIMGSGNIFYVLLLVAVIVLIICAALQFGEVTVNKGHP